MKKIVLICSLGLIMLACSISDVSNILTPLDTPTPLPSATKTVYVTPSDTPTITPTLPTPTFTSTPTFIGGVDVTDTPVFTSSPTSVFLSPLGGENSLLTPQLGGFSSVQISGNILRWGGCEPSSITFTARLMNPANVASVTLWIRLLNSTSGESTKWGAGIIMNPDNTGAYTYTVTPKNIEHYNEFPNAWLQYQIVAKDANFKDVARTQPYLNSITLSACH